jgi:hypothetical protein
VRQIAVLGFSTNFVRAVFDLPEPFFVFSREAMAVASLGREYQVAVDTRLKSREATTVVDVKSGKKTLTFTAFS